LRRASSGGSGHAERSPDPRAAGPPPALILLPGDLLASVIVAGAGGGARAGGAAGGGGRILGSVRPQSASLGARMRGSTSSGQPRRPNLGLALVGAQVPSELRRGTGARSIASVGTARVPEGGPAARRRRAPSRTSSGGGSRRGPQPIRQRCPVVAALRFRAPESGSARPPATVPVPGAWMSPSSGWW
jgi:hypothetical protein